MKPIILALCAAASLLAGCASNPDKDKQCATYAEVYELYVPTADVRPVSKEEVAAATAAAIFLRSYCGWTATRGNDSNSVPILRPPN